MDKFNIDSHKLIYHPQRVNDWQNGENIAPIYMEASPSRACNHRCTFCGLDFTEYERLFLDTEIFKQRLTEMGEMGLKSIMYAGEGEPLLHKDMAEIASHTKKCGIDVAFTTNASMMEKELAARLMEVSDWIKVSINAGSEETYSKIHRCKPAEFNKVIENMSEAAKIRQSNGNGCALGMQLLLLPENQNEVVTLAKLAKDIGMDYLVVKPYSQHPLSKTRIYEDIKYDVLENLHDELQKLNSDEFNVVFRINTMRKWNKEIERSYERCHALPFWSYIDSAGNVWGCSVYINDDRFFYGNINNETFKEIWEGEKRIKSLEWVENELDTSNCRVNCRMDEINRYLGKLKIPPVHANFI